jgi:5-methylcytosine-specific restriction endonuclease McrA
MGIYHLPCLAVVKPSSISLTNQWACLPQRIKKELRQAIRIRDGEYCHYCGKTDTLSVDHIRPIFYGGPITDLRNLQLLCEICHRMKTMADGLP